MNLTGSGGTLALIGGGEWSAGCDFDTDLWEEGGRSEVVVLPTAAAYEHPEREVARAGAYFSGLGIASRGLPVLARTDAEDEMLAADVRRAHFVYLGDGSPLHLRSVLKDSPVWAALVAAWRDGAVVAGSGAGAMVLGDPMVDPRGGALTLGLGLIRQVAVVPGANTWSTEKAQRTVRLATGDLRIVAVDEATAILRHPDGSWSRGGAGGVTVYAEGHPVALDPRATGPAWSARTATASDVPFAERQIYPQV
jgi:cyanophycinase